MKLPTGCDQVVMNGAAFGSQGTYEDDPQADFAGKTIVVTAKSVVTQLQILGNSSRIIKMYQLTSYGWISHITE